MRKTYYTLGGDKITLDDQHHVATGGEGSIYLKNGKAYKIYLDPAKAIRAGMDDKWKLLAQIKDPNIIMPIDALVNDKQQFIGLVFNEAKGVPLGSAFSTAWWTREGFTLDKCQAAVKNMRQLMQTAHDYKALMVDCNELNWMIQDTNIQVLDTDSWQIGPHPATAIMPAIADPHAVKFTENSDWYSWAIVTFQLWTGLHPFRGNHPVHGRDWAKRMAQNASVFDANVKMPPAVRPIDEIPASLRKWYEMMFSTTQRDAPPTSFGAIQNTVNRTVSNLRSLKLTNLYQAKASIKAVINGIAISGSGAQYTAYDLIYLKEVPLTAAQCEAILNSKAAITREGNVLHYLELPSTGSDATLLNLSTGQTGTLLTNAKKVWQSQNRVFIYEAQGTHLHEVSIASTEKMVIGSVSSRSCYPQSSKFFKHAYVQALYGKSVVGVLLEDGMRVVPAWELDTYHVLQMSYVDEKNLWVLGQDRATQEYRILRMEVDDFDAKILEVFQTSSPILNVGCAYPSGNKAIGLIELDNGLCMHRLDKQNLLTNENIGMLLTGLPFMAMIDGDRVYKVESK
jgi:hypothetical protein